MAQSTRQPSHCGPGLLALVGIVASGLLGACVAPQSGPDEARDGLTLAEVVRPVAATVREGGTVVSVALQFAWARMYFETPKWGVRTPILAVCHGDLYEGRTLVRFFLKRGELFVPRLEFPANWGYLKDPVQFKEGQDHFLFIRHNSGGSSSAWNNHVVWLAEDDVFEIPIQQPTDSLAHFLEEGQHSASYRTWIAVEDGRLRFSFSIWNRGEHNNFPSGGHVNGTLRLEREEERPARFVVDEWMFYPPHGDVAGTSIR